MPVVNNRCRFCGLRTCPHCPECGSNLVDNGHDRGCTRGPHCRACNDTGRNSRGGVCVPCEARGILPTQPAASTNAAMFD